MTISEAKAKMTFPEYLMWRAYFEKKGFASISGATIPHMQNGFALLAATLINVNGGYKGGQKAKITDFLPQRQDDSEGSPEEVAALLASTWSGKGKQKEGVRKLWKRARRK